MKNLLIIVTLACISVVTITIADTTYVHNDFSQNLFISAYALGRGGANVAESAGLMGMLQNPASIVTNNAFEAGASTGTALGYRYSTFAAATWQGFVLGFGNIMPTITETYLTNDSSETKIRERYGVQGSRLLLGYGLRLWDWMNAGLLLDASDITISPHRYEDTKLIKTTGGGTTLNTGLNATFDWAHVGLALRNAGSETSKTIEYGVTKDTQTFALRPIVSLGSSFDLFKNMNIALQGDFSSETTTLPTGYKFGMQYSFNEWLCGRLGYNSEFADYNGGGISAGAGFNVWSIKTNLGFCLGGKATDTKRSTQSFKLDATYYIPANPVTGDKGNHGRNDLDSASASAIGMLKSKAQEYEAVGDLGHARDNYDIILAWNPEDQQAISKLQELDLRIKQEEAEKHIVASKAFFASAAYSDAYLEAQNASKLDPTNKEAIALMESATLEMENSRSTRKQSVVKLMDDAVSAYQAQDYSQAIAVFTEVIKADPTNKEAIQYIGRAQNRMEELVTEYLGKAGKAELIKNYEEAIACYKKALSSDSSNSEAIAGLERCRKGLGDRINRLNEDGVNSFNKGAYSEAETRFRTVLSIENNNTTARSYLTRIEEAKKDKRTKPATIKTDYSKVYQMGVSSYSARDYSAAIGYWEQIPSDDAFYNKAQININRARAILEELNG